MFTPCCLLQYLTGKLSQAGTGMASSPDSSSDSSTGSPPRPGPDQPRLDIEVNLPGVVIIDIIYFKSFLFLTTKNIISIYISYKIFFFSRLYRKKINMQSFFYNYLSWV